jgi:hypothetical protein
VQLGNKMFQHQAFEHSKDIGAREKTKLNLVYNESQLNKTAVEIEAAKQEYQSSSIEDVIVDLVGGSKKDSTVNIPIDSLVFCRDDWNTFSEFPHDRKIELIESIIKFGVFHNIVVRATDKDNNKFEVLSGNNRTQAMFDAREITKDESKFSTIPAKVYLHGEISDEDAHAIVIMSNYIDRKELSVKDKLSSNIFLYNYYQKQKEQGKTKINNIAQYLSKKANISESSFYKQVGLRSLIPEFFAMLSNKQLKFTTAVKLCKLPSEYQEELFNNYKDDNKMLVKSCSIYNKANDSDIGTPNDLIIQASEALIPSEKEKQKIEISERTYSITASRQKDVNEFGFLLFVPKDHAEEIRKRIEEYIVSVMD